MQGIVDNLHLDGAISIDPIRRKSRSSIVDCKDDADFSRGVGVLNHRARIKCAQSRQKNLIRDLAGQPHMFRIDPASFTAHKDLAPMGRRAGYVGDFGVAEAGERQV